MQSRHSDGKMYAREEFTTYPGCEQMAAWQLSDAYMFFWLHSHKAIATKSLIKKKKIIKTKHE
jgi:hypothetical protein